MKDIVLEMGACAEPFAKQLAGKLSKRAMPSAQLMRHWDRDREAICRLVLRKLITDSQANVARIRLTKTIAATIKIIVEGAK